MSQDDIKAQVVRKALVLCVNRIESYSDVKVPLILESIKKQLEWLVSYFEGHNNEKDKLHTLMFGYYVAREFDKKDKEFAEALYKANYVASQTAKDLYIHLGVINK